MTISEVIQVSSAADAAIDSVASLEPKFKKLRTSDDDPDLCEDIDGEEVNESESPALDVCKEDHGMVLLPISCDESQSGEVLVQEETGSTPHQDEDDVEESSDIPSQNDDCCGHEAANNTPADCDCPENPLLPNAESESGSIDDVVNLEE